MFKCDYCKLEFKEPKIIRISKESYCGVASLFIYSTPMELEVCPRCKSESIVEEDNDS